MLHMSEESVANTRDALTHLIDAFGAFEAFECLAAEEAISVLQRAKEQADRASSGQFDSSLQDVLDYVLLQEDYRQDAILFGNRWRSLASHPVASDLRPQARAAIQRALQHREELTLSDFRELRQSLAQACGHKIKLRNAIKPWESPDRTAYQARLKEHYAFEAETASPKHRYRAINPGGLGEVLARSAETKSPLVFCLIAPKHVTSHFTDYHLPNQDTIKARGAEIVYAKNVRRHDIGGRNKTEVANLLGCAVYYYDHWSDSYALWHQYGGDDGRERLERLDATSLNPNQSSKASRGSAFTAGAAHEDDALAEPGERRPKIAPHSPSVLSKALLDEGAKELRLEFETQYESRILDHMFERLAPLVEEVVTARFVGIREPREEKENDLKAAIETYREHLELEATTESQVELATPLAPPESITLGAEFVSQAYPSNSRPAESYSKTHLRIEGDPGLVATGVQRAKDLSLEPRWVVFSHKNSELPWKAVLKVPQDRIDSLPELRTLGWKPDRSDQG